MKYEPKNPARIAAFGLLLALFVGCKQQAPQTAQAPAPAAKPPVELSVPPAKPELPPLFRDIERRTFQFFWDTTN
ncbi:MAG: hypothetical protein EOO80_18485, partial [Oxalobacteraceae bacterium]